jgi:hypothetical protein
MVAVLHEELGEGEGVRVVLAEVGREVPDAEGVGAHTREEGGAGWIADGLLAVGVREEGAAGGEGVDVRGLDVGETVAAEFGSEVVGGDEEDVGLARREQRDGPQNTQNTQKVSD